MADEPLWPYAPATLGRRFGQILKALGLVSASGAPQFTLASLRPGRATHWLQITEDAEYVRRNGRWLSTRVLEIYLQETTSATFHDHISQEAKSRIQALDNEWYPSKSHLPQGQFYSRANMASIVVMQGVGESAYVQWLQSQTMAMQPSIQSKARQELEKVSEWKS